MPSAVVFETPFRTDRPRSARRFCQDECSYLHFQGSSRCNACFKAGSFQKKVEQLASKVEGNVRPKELKDVPGLPRLAKRVYAEVFQRYGLAPGSRRFSGDDSLPAVLDPVLKTHPQLNSQVEEIWQLLRLPGQKEGRWHSRRNSMGSEPNGLRGLSRQISCSLSKLLVRS
eukprot:s3247_g3.t1